MKTDHDFELKIPAAAFSGGGRVVKSGQRTQKLKRVLVLEDDPFYAEILKNKISDEWPDCEIVPARNRRDFIVALEKGSYDLVLSDYLVPDFHGTLALDMVRRDFPDLPFIFVSGAFGDDAGVECLKLGATDYILKDRFARLVPAIERALDEADAYAKNHSESMSHEDVFSKIKEKFNG